jgi:flavodoxin
VTRYRPLLAMSLAAVIIAAALPVRGSPGGEAGVLILVLSRTGNTGAVARMIQQEVGGHLVELKLVTPYPQDYEAIVAQVDRENETGYLPPLATKIPDIGKYKTVFLGFPTWDMQLPPPMKSFLTQYDLKGKTVIPFNTNAGYGVGTGFDDVRSRAAGAKVLEGLSLEGGYEKKGIHLAIKNMKAEEVREKVRSWLKRIGMR